MNDLVIRTEQIGKAYDFGNRRGLVDLRERFSQLSRALFSPRRPNRNVWAVRNITFIVRRGEVIGIMGRNGSGKTTLLKILSGICAPTEGSAEIRGRVATLLDVGAGLHGELTGRENIYLNAATHGMSKREVRDVFHGIVAFSELASFLDQPMKYFSTGMCLRLAFAVAACQQCGVFLVDEVLAQADPVFQAKCLERMRASAAQGQAVLFVSHDLACMRKYCTRGMVFDQGQLVCDSSIDEAIASFVSETASRASEESEFRRETVTVEG
jgi:lipopolysaccharide transport system ATP-binding protein